MVFGYKKFRLTSSLILLLLVGCNSQDFSGGGSAAQPAKEGKKPVVPKPDPLPPPAPSCTEAKLISLKSLTSSVDQRSASRSVDVQLTFEPCPNQKTDLSYPVWFDLDANLDFGVSSSQNLNYELSGSGVQASAGTVSFVIGTDLFGKSGSEYGHFESSSPMRASPTLTTAVLKIKLNTVKILGPATGSAPGFGNFQIPLHVKVGSAAPVTGTLTFSQP